MQAKQGYAADGLETLVMTQRFLPPLMPKPLDFMFGNPYTATSKDRQYEHIEKAILELFVNHLLDHGINITNWN